MLTKGALPLKVLGHLQKGPDPALLCPCQTRGTGRKEEGRKDEGEQNDTKLSHAAQILPSSGQAASCRAGGIGSAGAALGWLCRAVLWLSSRHRPWAPHWPHAPHQPHVQHQPHVLRWPCALHQLRAPHQLHAPHRLRALQHGFMHHSMAPGHAAALRSAEGPVYPQRVTVELCWELWGQLGCSCVPVDRGDRMLPGGCIQTQAQLLALQGQGRAGSGHHDGPKSPPPPMDALGTPSHAVTAGCSHGGFPGHQGQVSGCYHALEARCRFPLQKLGWKLLQGQESTSGRDVAGG